MINDNTPITAEILLRNGWDKTGGYDFETSKAIDDDMSWIIKIRCVDSFACFLLIDNNIHGEPFYTIGELKAIARALYKVELKFE